ncbi:hypothetical protein ACLQ3C_19945 [Gordonia sp. DT30]|uniref:hypothetical protein n=1 Tax=Gordonia sp. DT30 TaxID=3416546 RepID=UPI003CF482E3
MTPAELLGYAQQLLRGLGDTTAGNSARLAAVVARQSLEACVDDRCAAVADSCHKASMRSRLAILKALDDRETADRMTYLWGQLSACCHQHAYELSPTVGEVRALCEGVSDVLAGDAATSS